MNTLIREKEHLIKVIQVGRDEKSLSLSSMNETRSYIIKNK